MLPKISRINAQNSHYPTTLGNGTMAPPIDSIWTIGNLAILESRLLGFFCSAKCPGEVILRTFDMARALRDAGVPVIGGFHSPMEKERLDLLLRGIQPIVICPARGIQHMRIPVAWRLAIENDRLLIVSPFEEKHRRVTAELAERRNHFVAALATDAFIAHAGPGTKTERLSWEMLDSGMCVHTIDVPDNETLVSKGVISIRVDQVNKLTRDE